MSSAKVKQAIFASVRGRTRSGYQLTAVSPGFSSAETRELSQWGPSHDSLMDTVRGSVNFHRLGSGSYCISKTRSADAEYSGRGGLQVRTHSLVAPQETLKRFSFDPFRLLEAGMAAGHLDVPETAPDRLPLIRLVGGATAFNNSVVRRVADELGHHRLSLLLDLAINESPLGIVTRQRPERLLHCLFHLLPPQVRGRYSFSSGLKISPRRPFRLTMVPADGAKQRQIQRKLRIAIVDLTSPVDGQQNLQAAWARLIQEALSGDCDIDFLMRRAAEQPTENLDEIAESVQYQLQ